jgi:hypothetical protein
MRILGTKSIQIGWNTCPGRNQHRQTIHNRVAAAALLAVNRRLCQDQAALADGAYEPIKMLRQERRR